MLRVSRRFFRPLLVSLVAVTSLGLAGTAVVASQKGKSFVQRETMGDLEVIHARVLLNGATQQGISRLALGDRITTESAGRARLLLAGGVTLLLDEHTEVKLVAERIELTRGRLFVDSPEGKKTSVSVGALNAPLSASKIALERSWDGKRTKIFCAQGEILVSGTGPATRVPSGETLTAMDGKVTVLPEKAFEDWTGGLAVPWAATGLTRSALADVWVTDEFNTPITPLHVSTLDVDVVLRGEFALTRSRTRYYNGNDQPVAPSVRLALPPEAILTKVSHRLSDAAKSDEAKLVLCAAEFASRVNLARLEWAGNGWLSGQLPMVPPGGSVDLELEYGEWLSAHDRTLSYRYPIGHRADPPVVGEFELQIDARQSGASTVEANLASTIDGKQLTWRGSDAKPSDDWVVGYAPEFLHSGVARAYVESSTGAEDPYVLIRAETPSRKASGVELAIVVDSSRSVGEAGLELSRQIVEALLGNLSEQDRAVVLAADEDPQFVGPAALSSNTRELRDQIQTGLSQIRPGGASHLVKALERAADALDAEADTSRNRLVIYLGDSRPSLGELSADRIRAELQRRAGGIPRMAGVAVGSNADRWLLARLVAGSGPVHSVIDRSEAAQVAAKIVAAAEDTADRDVNFDLGPNIDRIYPREGRAISAGTTAMVVGRLRGSLPNRVQLSYRNGSGRHNESLRVERLSSPHEGETARQWARARIDELLAGSEGMEPALLLAQKHGLLLPWTEWILRPNDVGTRASCSKFSNRVIELSTLNDTPYARRIEEPAPSGGGWLEPPLVYEPGASMEQGARSSAATKLGNAIPALQACRDARSPIIGNLPVRLTIGVELDAAGQISRVTVSPTYGGTRDAVFLGCAERVVRGIRFVGADQNVTASTTVELLGMQDTRRSRCSLVSRLPLPIRRSAWAGQTGEALGRYLMALKSCELPTWRDRRELLLLLSTGYRDAEQLMGVATQFSQAGHADAASFMRELALKRVRNLDELKQMRSLQLRDEPNLDADIAAKVKQARTDKLRLEIVTRAIAMAPHSPLGRRLQLLLLERLGDSGSLLRAIEAIRNDPYTDAGLLARAASTLNRLEHAAEAQRSFSELFERIPNDPWVLAFAGDQLRNEGFSEQAILAYDALGRTVQDDPATLLRTALSQAAVGRVDIATRLLDRAAQVPGRSDDQRLNELASVLRAFELGRALNTATDAAERQELGRRLAQTALPDVQALVLVEAPADPEQGLAVTAYRGEQRPGAAPDLDASPLGIAAIFAERGAQTLRLEIARQTLAGLARALPITISILSLGEHPNERQLRRTNAAIGTDQERTSVTLSGELRP